MKQIRSLIDYLNEQTHKYNCDVPDISDKEYDEKYFELKTLEDAYHIYYPDSPTQSIQYQVVNSLEKVVHNHDMLSLDKTKSPDEILDFLGKAPYIAMLKMDGLTCSLMYEDGQLVSAETRGNGQVGENILHNAKVVKNIPQQIQYKERLVVDGEIICKLDDFSAFSEEYKNPRNFASGSIRLLDSKECQKRNLTFVAWEVIEGLEELPFLSTKLDKIKFFGFTTVPWIWDGTNGQLTFDAIKDSLVEEAKELAYPIDGLVFKFNDWRFGKSLGQTGHHARNAIAYKFYDEEYETTLRDITYDIGRTGVLTPVAVFDPIEIDGSVCERASLHNLSVMEELSGGFERIGDRVWVYKANAIIPQVSRWEHISEYSEENHIALPEVCPICSKPTAIKNDTGTKFLICTNPECEGKFINHLENFAGKKGLDIKGISKATLEKLMDWGWLNTVSDLFKLQEHRNEWVKKPGFGSKSVDNILNAIESSRQCDLDKFIAALGIPLIGTSASKDLAKHFGTWEAFIEAVDNDYHFYDLPNFGSEMHSAIMKYNYEEACDIASKYLTFNEVSSTSGSNSLDGLTFVITGKVSLVAKNRDEFKRKIESAGGKVVGSVSGKTSYLINNDIESTSAKNQTAKKLGVPIISEEMFIETFGSLD